jgi:chaperone modulatory protein CbpM
MIIKREVVAGVILDERSELTLSDLSRCCAVRKETIVALVEEGILTPATSTGGDYRFAGASVKRATRALRLQRDLELDLAAVALAVDLLEEIELLRERLRLYEQ